MRSLTQWIGLLAFGLCLGFSTNHAVAQAPVGPPPVEIYGVDLVADTFVWVFDKSASSSAAFGAMQSEITDAISQLSATQDTTAIAFNDTVSTWMSVPQAANVANQGALATWVNLQFASGATCFVTPILDGIAAASAGSGPRRAVVLISDGVSVCGDFYPQFLSDVTALATAGGVVVHTIYSGPPTGSSVFLQLVAAAGGGIYADSMQIIFPPPGFSRGDVDGDGTLGIADIIRLLSFIFASGPALSCDDAADFDDDGVLALFDAVSGLNALFNSGPLPGPLFCDEDPTSDALDCANYAACP